MPSTIPEEERLELIAFFTPEGFSTDLLPASGKRTEHAVQARWYQRFREHKYQALYQLGFLEKQSWMTPSVLYLHRIADLFIRRLSSRPDIELMRESAEAVLETEDLSALKEEVPFVNGSEAVDEQWLSTIWSRLQDCYRSEMEEYDGTAAAYFAERNSRISVAGRVFFHLVENKPEQGRYSDYPFAFMATYSTRPVKSKKAIHTPLKNALTEFKKDQAKLLSLMSTVARAADQSPLISELMESGELFSPLGFTVQEAYTFLKEIPLYEEAGIMCRVPDWWRKRTNSLKLSVAVGAKKPAGLGMDAIMDFKPTLTVDGEPLTEDQLREFMKMAEGLVQYKGKWVEINRKKLEAALEAFEKVKEMAARKTVTIAEAMRLELSLKEELAQEDAPEISVTNGAWLKAVKEKLADPGLLERAEPAPTLRARLRTYQLDGYRWLYAMAQLGFGACLADDMGLGKTVQMIAFLEHLRLNRGGHALLILPASLIGNWQKELEKFAPELTYQVLHKSAAKTDDELSVDETKFLCITTYGMAVRLTALTERTWDCVVLDEAQAIKNAGTKQSKAIRAIPAAMRIAMTGTPIENRLGDLWSLFDFLDRGLLGTAKEFSGLVKLMEEDKMGYSRLKKTVSPFILRRLKTDRSIITDLPDKIETREYAPLSKKQVALYRKLVGEVAAKLKAQEEADSIERRGIVLASIMQFKQICNHPDQYLGLETFKPENSGKFQQLEQICETIRERRERLLVFTQFKEMTEPLSDFLTSVFHRRGLVLHGGTPVKERAKMVEAFNGEDYIPYMVLSLKAGGVGLNLTAANHVVHFDRWWNPAVENQATDRAFRIGQTKNVIVHKFVTKGTIEEKIDAMIEEKQKLAGDILSSSGEQWITRLSNDELIGLFELGAGNGTGGGL